MALKEFQGRTAYITGGSSGIGLAAAELLANEGAHVLIMARNEDRLRQSLAQVKGSARSSDQRFGFKSLDVSVREQVERAAAEAAAEFGPPDLLINCAGRAIPRRFEDIGLDQFDRTMKINLYGIWHLVSALLPVMKTKGRGHIVNVSSVAGLIGVFGYTDYCASKFAIIGFSEALRAEVKPYGLGVSVLCPPDTDTPGLIEENKTKPEETKAISGAVKLMSAQDVARAMLSGVKKDKFLILPSLDARLSNLVKRLLPGVLNWYMDLQVRRVQKSS
ncbi:MAG: SDR family oxidoreductase [Thermodesulfobacteriota bacterium]